MKLKEKQLKKRSKKAPAALQKENERLQPSEVKHTENNPRPKNSGNNFGLKWFPQDKR